MIAKYFFREPIIDGGSANLKYRPEIDGLRAIAVVLVLLFHLELTKFGSGGFIGVDVFFVISGYLITRHLQKDINKGFAGIADFYHRRVLRIFPALFATYAFCTVVECFYRFPSTINAFSKSLLSSVFFSSNVYLYETINYFDWDAKSNSLLHTWSLSIEEQFYIFLPVLLMSIVSKSKLTQLIVFIGTLLVSLGASVYFVQANAEASFYLMPLRAWELLAGSLLSLGFLPRIKSWLLANALGLSGVGVILYSAITFNRFTAFPGFSAVLPVAGTALVLVSTGSCHTLTARALSIAPMQILGKISYSLYLWHWPLIVYSRYWHPLETRTDKTGLLALSVAIAWVSWRFVEQPFRGNLRRLPVRFTLGVSALAMVSTSILAIAIPSLSSRLWPRNEQAEAALTFLSNYDWKKVMHAPACFQPDNYFVNQSNCMEVASDRTNALIFGDSHAAMLWYGLVDRYRDVNFLQATAPSCTAVNSYNSPKCAKFVDRIVDDFLPKHHLDAIIVSGKWSYRDIDRLDGLLDRLRPHTAKLILIGPFPEYSLPFPEVAARVIYAGRPELLKHYLSSQTIPLDNTMGKRFANSDVTYISAYRTMCSPQCAERGTQGDLVMWDNDHLSDAGSLLFAERLPGRLFDRTTRNQVAR
jgi:peptidoglycan/LPS O-acetylase OafA/YrhL